MIRAQSERIVANENEMRHSFEAKLAELSGQLELAMKQITVGFLQRKMTKLDFRVKRQSKKNDFKKLMKHWQLLNIIWSWEIVRLTS